MKKLATLLLSLVALTIGCTALNAQNPEGRRGPGGPGGPGRMDPEVMIKRMTENLNLTADQVTKIKAIFDEQKKEIDAIPADQRREKMREVMTKYREKIGAVLTAEQKDKWEKMRPQGGPRGKGREKSSN